MVRNKIKIKRIENASARRVTFSKRRGGLMKKAHELAVLCDADVGVIIFSSKGKIFQFASPSMQTVLERYISAGADNEVPANNSSTELPESNASTENVETDRVSCFTQKLKNLQRNVIGEDLERLSMRDIIHLEQRLHESLRHIQAKKEELLVDQLKDMNQKMVEVQTATNGISSVLNSLVNFCSADITVCGKSGGQVACNDVP